MPWKLFRQFKLNVQAGRAIRQNIKGRNRTRLLSKQDKLSICKYIKNNYTIKQHVHPTISVQPQNAKTSNSTQRTLRIIHIHLICLNFMSPTLENMENCLKTWHRSRQNLSKRSKYAEPPTFQGWTER